MSSLSGKQGPRYRHIAGDTEPYETISVEKLTPIIGAEISGVDIGRLVSDEQRSNRQIDEIHRALAENLVIFFRDQHITPQQHLAFGRKFGELHIHPAAPHEGGDPALMKIHADKDSPRANGLAHGCILRPRAADGLDPLHQAMPAARRRHAVRQHVRGL
jgi:TfdA family taurine catabolism dioxygenase TauD